MEVKPPTNDLYSAIARSVPATTPNNVSGSTPPDWKVTQLIQAVITQITDKQLLLNIQGVKANTVKPDIPGLQIGDILKLQIEQLKPMPQFRIVSLQKAMDTHLITQALKNIAAQQTSTTPLLKDISYIANRPALRPSPLPADVNAAVRDIFKQLPSPFNLKTATQVKNQLQNSGTFIESNIKNQLFSAAQNTALNRAPRITHGITPQITSHVKSALEHDLGAQLHRLANLIRTQLPPMKSTAPLDANKIITPAIVNTGDNKVAAQQMNRAPAEQASFQNITQREEAMHSFLRQVESSLTHMQQTQLQNLNESQPGRPLWLMELPIKDGQDIDVFQLRISEEDNPQVEGENKKIWNVTLQFDLTGLGKVKAHIKMQNELISAQFFSEKAEVLSLFRDNFDFLRGRLSYNGLNVGKIDCAHAKLSEDVSPQHSTRLDERT
ncbi:MAG: flagellar hook-length control protein FliK [Gammaproteobacteria bacterium]|nr:flagellar hook-length control protein FliK [Gammaproteobacteria bacterium]MCW8986692.1 flagellar hook-length control protein FliK [Gammaproteobacteria bacterium]